MYSSFFASSGRSAHAGSIFRFATRRSRITPPFFLAWTTFREWLPITTPVLADLLRQEVQLKLELEGARRKYGPEHRAVQTLEAKLGDAFGRLDRCGADPGLVKITKRCLAPLRRDRLCAGELAYGRAVREDVVYMLGGDEQGTQQSIRSERLAEELAFRIAAKSDGNPFFVFEIIRGLREGQLISRNADGTWASTQEIREILIPSSVVDLIQARITGLSAEEAWEKVIALDPDSPEGGAARRALDSLRSALQGCDVVHSVAAMMSQVFTDPSPDLREITIQTNVKGTLNALRAAREIGARRVIVTSSCSTRYRPGGALANEGTATAEGSTFAGNSAQGHGGAISNAVNGLPQ